MNIFKKLNWVGQAAEAKEELDESVQGHYRRALDKKGGVKEPGESLVRAYNRRERRLYDRRAAREEAKTRRLAWKFDFWGFPHVTGVSAMEAREAAVSRAQRNAAAEAGRA